MSTCQTFLFDQDQYEVSEGKTDRMKKYISKTQGQHQQGRSRSPPLSLKYNQAKI